MNAPDIADGDRLYAIDKADQILGLCRRIIERRCLFTVNIDAGETTLLTSILAIADGGRALVVDTSPDESMNRRALQGHALMFQTQLDQVDVRFRTRAFRPTLHFGMPAFLVEMPTNVFYLQQREHFRLRIPLSHAVTCSLAIDAGTPDAPTALLQSNARDISVGGLGLALTLPQAEMLVPGSVYPDCRIALPDHGPLSPTMRLCHMQQVKDMRGLVRVHAGFQFTDPTPAMQAAIQRYIMRVERMRIARDRDLA